MSTTTKEDGTIVWTNDKLFSSKKQDWGTPWDFFAKVNEEFNFVLDAAASEENHKCPLFLTENSLGVSWWEVSRGGAVWLNPPYGREVGRWIEKAYLESTCGCAVVCLTFARTDTKWWHDWAMRAAEIRLVKGRIKFQGAENSAPAPSCLLVFDETRRRPQFTTMER
tara:strand:- start:1252 stop:1752 length:501 start_codon:yes stop_codon:yes gene_type:complete